MSSPNPEPYTSAQFRTDRDALGLSVPYLAGRLGVADVTVWKYQSSNRTEPVPVRVRDLMAELYGIRADLVVDLSEYLSLNRPATDEALAAEYPQIAGWGLHAFGLILAAAQERAQVEHDRVLAVAWMGADS